VERLEDRSVPTADLGLVKSSLPGLFQGFQRALNQQAFQGQLPLLGTHLQDAGGPGQVMTGLGGLVQPALNGLPAHPTTAQVSQALVSGFGPDLTSINTTGVDGGSRITFDLTLDDSIVGTVPFSTGLPGKLDFQGGTAGPEVDTHFHLVFGVQDNTFFLDASPADELSVYVHATAQNPPLPFFMTGRLGFMNLLASDTGSVLDGTFRVGVTAPTTSFITDFSGLSLPTTFQGIADVKLHLGASAGTSFPTVTTDAEMQWSFGPNAHPSDALFGQLQSVSFNHVRLNLGEFFDRVVRPVVDRIHQVTGPLGTFLDVLYKPLPVLSAIPGEGNLNLGQIIDAVSGSHMFSDFKSVYDVINAINSMPVIAPDAAIDFGSFTLDTDLRQTQPQDETFHATASDQGNPDDQLYKISADGHSLVHDGGWQFPLIEDPNTVAKLLLGQKADFFTFQTPRLAASFSIPGEFPILGPIVAVFNGTLNVSAQMAFGYDSTGLTDPDPTYGALKGFFVSAAPSQQDLFDLGGSLSAGVGLDVGIARASLQGYVAADLRFALYGPDGDGRVYLPQLAAAFQEGLLCPFKTRGSLRVGLSASVEVGIGPFGWSDSVDFGSIKLLDFSHTCAPTPPQLAGPAGRVADTGGEPTYHVTDPNGVLTLNMGPNAYLRLYGNLNDGDENFTVTHVSGSPTDPAGETVEVTALGHKELFTGVRRIYAEGGYGDNVITISPGVLAPAELWGGFNPNNPHLTAQQRIYQGGHDTLQAGDGPTTLHGGTGSNRLVAGAGDDQLYGGGSSASDLNFLVGGAGHDLLVGGAGENRLYGGTGSSILQGGGGPNFLQAGTGDDRLVGGTGTNVFVVHDPSGDLLRSSDPYSSEFPGIIIQGSRPDDTLIIGGDGQRDGITEQYTLGTAVHVGEPAQSDARHDGTIEYTAGPANTLLQRITFTNVGSLFDTLTVGSLVASANDQISTIDVTNGGLIPFFNTFVYADSQPPYTAAQFVRQDLHFTEIATDPLQPSSLPGFTPGFFGNKTAITVRAGDGNHTITLDNATPETGLRSLQVDAGGGNHPAAYVNVVNVLSTAAGVTTTVTDTKGYADQGNAPHDTVNVGNAADGVQDISGTLWVQNQAGTTALTVDDSSDPAGRRVTLTNSAVTGLAPAPINYQGSALSALAVTTGSPNTGTWADFSTITVLDTPPARTRLNVGSNLNPYNNGGVYVAGTTGPLDVYRHSAPSSPDVRVVVGSSTSEDNGSTLVNVKGPVSFFDTAPKTWVVILDTTDTFRRRVTFSDHDVRFDNGLSAVINYQPSAMLGSVVVRGSDGGNDFIVQSTAPGVAADLRIGPGGDTVSVRGTSNGGSVLVRNTDGFSDTVTVGVPPTRDAGVGLGNIHGHVLLFDDLSRTSLVIDDRGDTADHDGVSHPALNLWADSFNGFDLNNYYTSIEVLGPTRSLNSLFIYEGSGTDALTVQGTVPGTATTIYADNPLKTGPGPDTINVVRYDASGNATVKNVVSPLTIYGRPDRTAVTLDDSGNGPADQVTITPQGVGGPGDNFFGTGGSLTYLGLKSLTVNTASNPTTGDTIALSPNPGTAYVLNAGSPAAAGGTLSLNVGGLPAPAVAETGPGSGCWTFGGPPAVTYTHVASQQVTGAPGPFLLGPQGAPGTPPPALHWVGLAGAARYEVLMTDITDLAHPQTVLDDANVTGTSRPAPGGLLANHRYRWTVRAFDSQGTAGPWANALEFTA
jgi:hypothetical protein